DKKDDFNDVVMTVDTFGRENSELYYEMVNILLNGETIGSDNYIFNTVGNKRYFSIKSEYLQDLPVGIYPFTLVTVAGTADFIIEIKDTRDIAVSHNYFEHTLTVSESDIIIIITTFNHVVECDSFSIEDIEFKKDEDYSYLDNELTIFSNFLETLTPSLYQIKINTHALITFVVKEATAPKILLVGDINIAQASYDEDLAVELDLFGLENQTVLYANDALVDSSDYLISGNTLTIDNNYIKTLDYGSTIFTVTNSHGEDYFKLNISDKPDDNGVSQNVTKFTNEVITDEPFRITAIAPWDIAEFTFMDIIYYDYVDTIAGSAKTGVVTADGKEASGDFGKIILDDKTKGFRMDRAAGWFGIMVFNYIATDSIGVMSDVITMDILYLQRIPNIGEKDIKIYNRANGTDESGDIVYTLITAPDNDFPIYQLFQEEYQLQLDIDYTVGTKVDNNCYFTIKAAYLNTLDDGKNPFTFYTTGGKVDFVVTVVSPLTTDVDTKIFDVNMPDDVYFDLAGAPLAVTGLKYGTQQLTDNDYDFTDGIFSISSTYLNTLPYGTAVLTVSNDYGNLDLMVNIIDSRNPVLLTDEVEYIRTSLATLKISLYIYDKQITALKYQGLSVNENNYHYNNNLLTISGDYLESISEEDTVDFTIVTTTLELYLKVTVIETVCLPEINLVSAEFMIDQVNNLVYSVDLKGGTLSGITYQGAALKVDEDYTYNENTLTIKGRYLIGIYRFGNNSATLLLETTDGTEVGFTVPFDHANYRILNGGFETGNLYGWNSIQIWKNEEGMVAWTDDRVVDGGYFDENYAYNRDGAYNLGIYGGTISKDSGQERMGHLRSSNFILGGTGWISFKLGGGANSSFAYVSVRRTADNIEVARFGNPRFKETNGADSEAYMFQYYFDLSTVAVIGDSLYMTISDTSSYEWCVLSADSIFTYYEETPIPGDKELAVNIVPEILNIESADNSIKNGYFDEGLDYWSNVNNQFRIENGFAISNVDGDGATGVLRSSAFTVIGNKYIRFDWAGRLRADKQIFVSVKEAETNIEVLRFVRRDNLSGKENGDFDNHLLDLTSLDANKLYYLEFTDNTGGSWGVCKMDSIRLINEEEYNGIDSGDRAVSIDGIEKNFVYILPY
ncbi:MAG: hypothetical protein M0R05_07190, partial [Bacilli bacterium]|nr:hypothetical protein [Bacilli bacterium]